MTRRLARSLIAAAVLPLASPPLRAYVEAPLTIGAVIQQSSHVMVLRVEQVDRERNLILYRKVEDLKGKHPADLVKHNIGRGGLRPGEWQEIMGWAEPGKLAVFFHNGGASETFMGPNWYQAYAGGEWWNMSHAEPYLLRSFAGKPEKLAAAVRDILAGREVVVPCMADGSKDDLHAKRGRIQRLRASLKLQDYNPKRDFAGWGGDDLRRVAGMPGFSHLAGLTRMEFGAQAISFADFDGDGRLDVCLAGARNVALFHNGGDSFSETSLPGFTGGCRAAVWADHNGDGKPDLLLATAAGPRLFTNLGGGFRDDSNLLPPGPCRDLTAAAWTDADADGRPDILLASGYHGLRLYRNKRPENAAQVLTPPKLGPWHAIGPFDNPNNQGFDTVYPPEKEVNLSGAYPGKGGEPAAWKPCDLADGAAHSLLPLFRPEHRADAVVYLYRAIEAATPTELPVSLGSDDGLAVWLNGEKLVSENVQRAIAPDQNRATLKLRPGTNHLLLKVTQGGGEWGFYFKPGEPAIRPGAWFEDVSAAWGLGPEGLAGRLRGDTLAVADVNGDGRCDFLYGAGTGVLALNTGKGFAIAADSGISYRPGKVGPVFGDSDGDGDLDLFVPQEGVCKLFRNDGAGRFTPAEAGDLSKPLGRAASAAWGDFDNDGHLDLFVGCLLGANRYLRNNGDGTFADRTAEIGLDQRIYNSQAVALADLNGDGKLDLVLNNEGQESLLLLGDPGTPGPRTPVLLACPGIGGRVRVLDGSGRVVCVRQACGGEGRGGQPSPAARVALPPGAYRVEWTGAGGKVAAKEVAVAATPLRVGPGGKEQ